MKEDLAKLPACIRTYHLASSLPQKHIEFCLVFRPSNPPGPACFLIGLLRLALKTMKPRGWGLAILGVEADHPVLPKLGVGCSSPRVAVDLGFAKMQS